MSTHEAIIYVYLPKETTPVPAARLTVIDDVRAKSATLAYGRRYLQRPNAIPLDPIELPLEERVFETKPDFSLFAALNDQLPDAWGRHVISRLRGLGDLPEFDFLTLQDKDTRTGALGFGRDTDSGPGTFLEPEFSHERQQYLGNVTEADLAKIMGEIERLDTDALSPQLRPFLLRGSSVGGARPKLTCLYHGKPAIAKFQRDDDTFNVCKLEYALMTVAGELGMNVPRLSLQSIGKKSVYVIERFDRSPLGLATDQKPLWGRRHFISALTAVEGHEMDRDRWAYQDLVDFIRRFSDDFRRDMRELFTRMTYNVLVANTDDHLKNHAFLYKEDRRLWQLSPLYDVVSSLSDRSTDKRGFLIIGNQGRVFSKSNLMSAAAGFQLGQDEAKHIFEVCQSGLQAKLPMAMETARFSREERDILQRYLENHWRSL